jgi:hypothetical protein
MSRYSSFSLTRRARKSGSASRVVSTPQVSLLAAACALSVAACAALLPGCRHQTLPRPESLGLASEYVAVRRGAGFLSSLRWLSSTEGSPFTACDLVAREEFHDLLHPPEGDGSSWW